MVIVVIVTALPVIWAIFYFGIYAGYGSWKARGHQEFAKNGIAQIQPAAEMETLFDECRHFIIYTGSESVSTWNATAYFDGRYQLTMQVPVEIESARLGTMIGEPRFFLNEVDVVSLRDSGQVSVSYSRSFNFDVDEWQKVFSSGGDFSSIGFTLKTTAVPHFKKIVNADRPSN
ncbi:hypothetical protein N9B73_04030 [Verrucomicrobiales bacterium]|nr:hypothetical protein [Verrucomicrobiales bacterium]